MEAATNVNVKRATVDRFMVFSIRSEVVEGLLQPTLVPLDAACRVWLWSIIFAGTPFT
jgi:hypothetical protein